MCVFTLFLFEQLVALLLLDDIVSGFEGFGEIDDLEAGLIYDFVETLEVGRIEAVVIDISSEVGAFFSRIGEISQLQVVLIVLVGVLGIFAVEFDELELQVLELSSPADDGWEHNINSSSNALPIFAFIVFRLDEIKVFTALDHIHGLILEFLVLCSVVRSHEVVAALLCIDDYV